MKQVLVPSQNIFAFVTPAVQPWRSFHMPRLPPRLRLPVVSHSFSEKSHIQLKQRYSSVVQRAKNASTIPSTQASQSSAAQTESQPQNEKWQSFLALATSLYPVYVTLGGILAISNPSAFSWFVSRGPTSYSLSLGTIMLAMGLSLRLEDLVDVITKRSFPLIFGCAAQYTIMPLLAAAISKMLGLSSALSAGLILLGCCPGGTASNVVTYIARGDVPLSVVMTTCTTLSAVFATPLLTQYLAGTYVPVDAVGLALSTLQVVLAPVILGSWLQSTFPKVVAQIVPYSPVTAVLISSLLACSVFSANVGLLGSSMTVHPSTLFNLGKAVFMLHAGGFFLGYVVSQITGVQESQCRAISIEVGMQNSSLGVVLATSHFSSPLVAVPAALSAVLMNIMGSGLGVFWRHFGSMTAESEP